MSTPDKFPTTVSPRNARHFFTAILVCYDFATVFAVLFLMQFVRSLMHDSLLLQIQPGHNPLIFFIISTLWTLALAVAGVYNDEKSFLDIEHSKRTLKGVCFGFCVVMLILYSFVPLHNILLFAFSFTFSSLLIFYGHILLHQRFLYLKTAAGQRILIYGAGHLGKALFSIIGSSRHSLIPVGFIDDDPAKQHMLFQSSGLVSRTSCQVLGSIDELHDIATKYHPELLIVAISDIDRDKLHAIFQHCLQLGMECSFVPSLHGFSVYDIHATLLGDIPIVRFHPRPKRLYKITKRLLDFCCSALLLLLLSPLLLCILATIYASDWRNPFFVHTRTGLNGRPFRMYKFRTMHCASDPYALTPTCSDDCRITRIGRILRKTSLDELPQLLNVLKGEMSLVGPRPEMPFITSGYTAEQNLRLRVKPGITGLWQISVDRHQAIHENLEYDFYYIRNCSFFLDLTILLETVAFLFRGI